jgi:tRNA U55 pseudouridine synthase TruB
VIVYKLAQYLKQERNSPRYAEYTRRITASLGKKLNEKIQQALNENLIEAKEQQNNITLELLEAIEAKASFSEEELKAILKEAFKDSLKGTENIGNIQKELTGIIKEMPFERVFSLTKEIASSYRKELNKKELPINNSLDNIAKIVLENKAVFEVAMGLKDIAITGTEGITLNGSSISDNEEGFRQFTYALDLLNNMGSKAMEFRLFKLADN